MARRCVRSAARDNFERMLALLFACGLDANKTLLFQQSRAGGAHCLLAWILACSATVQQLRVMNQYKDKMKSAPRHKLLGVDEQWAGGTVGLLTYPILQAADILLYGTDLVPVGQDQWQHLKLAQSLAEKFNNCYDVSHFRRPEKVKGKLVKLKCFREPARKMSKSTGGSTLGRLNLSDSDEQIRTKCRRAVTDSFGGVSYDAERRPGLSNLLNLYAALTGEGVTQASQACGSWDTVRFKNELADLLIAKFGPIRRRYFELLEDRNELRKMLESNNERAAGIADSKVKEILEIIGFL